MTFDKEVKPLLDHVTVFVDGASDHDARSHYFRQQIVAGAKTLEYFANMETYRAWARLVIHNANQSQLLIVFHGIGHEFRGVLACCAVFFQRVQTDRDDRESSPAKALARAVFQTERVAIPRVARGVHRCRAERVAKRGSVTRSAETAG